MHELVFTLSTEIEWFRLVKEHEDRFEHAFDRTVSLLRENPQMGKAIRIQPLRRVLVPRTEWGIFYGVFGDRIVISAIVDLRQHPRTIERKLRELLP